MLPTISKHKLIREMDVDELKNLKVELMAQIRDSIDPGTSHAIALMLGEIDNQLKQMQ